MLHAALGFLALEPREPELRRLHECFDSWRGIGDIVAVYYRERNRAASESSPSASRANRRFMPFTRAR